MTELSYEPTPLRAHITTRQPLTTSVVRHNSDEHTAAYNIWQSYYDFTNAI